ncbi:hypothetical protein AY606_00415 [Acinetobacter sp. SFB]|nr:hypothetical protein AY606_00415 [Acinetobacter sp. SFB]
MKDLLEPIYLNEKMLLNCAGYLFDGVETSTNISQTNSNQSNNHLKGTAVLGTNGILEWLAKAEGNFEGQLDNQNNNNYSRSSTKYLTLGALHMKVLKELYQQKFVYEISNISNIKNEIPYKKIEGILQPVDFFEIIQIIKSLTPHFETIFNLFGNQIFNTPVTSHKKSPVNNQAINAKNGIQILTGVINELEKNYLESNLLEMMILNEDGECIGIVDLDINDQDPKRIKAQLTDGYFHIYGKITKIVSPDGEIDLIQRSLISPLLRILQHGFVAWQDHQKATQFLLIKDIIMEKLNQVLRLKIKGPAVRIRAMSICI